MKIRRIAGTAVSAVSALAMVFTSVSAAQAVTVDASGVQHLTFNNTLKIGANAAYGFNTRYSNVVSGVDAILTVTNITNVTLSNVDRVSPVDNWQLWTNESIGSGGGSATYRIDFVKAGTSEPVTLTNIAINVGDIDARQYVQFAGPQSYTLTSDTALRAQTHADVAAIPTGAYRFWEPNGVGSLDTDTRYWAQVNYNQISSIDIQLGGTVGGSALYQVAFGAAPWSGPAPAPVTPPAVSYTVTYNANGASTGAVPAATTQTSGTAHAIDQTGGSLTYPAQAGWSGPATFLGWNTRSDGTGVFYSKTGSAETLTPSTDVTLYAVWDFPAAITLTYHADGATSGSAPAAAVVDGWQTISGAGSLSKTGYDFVGWTTAIDGSGNPAAGSIPYEAGDRILPTANTDLYPVWREQPVVPSGSPINIDVAPGAAIPGAEVPYVVPGLEPGSSFELVVDPTSSNDPTIPIDAGTVPASGTAEGTAVLPENLPEGVYELTFSGTAKDGAAETISKSFTVSATGTLVSQEAKTTTVVAELPNTGLAPLPTALAGFAALGLGGAAVALGRRRRID